MSTRKNIEFIPLSLTQQDIYFDQLQNVNSPMYNVGGYIQLEKVNITQLRDSHSQVVKQNDVFGIRIIHQDTSVSQYITEQRNTALPMVDFSQDDSPDESADQWLKSLFETTRSIDDCELYSAYLLKLSSANYRYVGLAHHLVMDGWGFANWARSLGNIYNHNVNDCSDDKTVSCSDGSMWQTVVAKDIEYLSSERYRKDENYWKSYLKDIPDRFIASQYRNHYQGLDVIPSQRKSIPISYEVHSKLTQLAKETGVSVAQAYFAIFSVYYAKVYDKQELIIGVPSHNRKGIKQKQMVGVFTSVSPLKLSIPKDISWQCLCEQIMRQQKQSFRHQRFPFSHMIRQSNTMGNQGAIYDISFNYLKMDSQLELEGHKANLVYLSHNHEVTPVTMTLWEYGENQPVEILIDYSLVAFSELDVELIEKRLSWIIQQFTGNRIEKINQIDAICPEEKSKLISYSQLPPIFSTTSHSQSLLHRQFENAVLHYPDEIALHCQEVEISYKELNQKANQLAHLLLAEKKDRADSLVGIYLHRSVDLLIAILATLKSGSAYVPLDPAYPDNRINYMIEDAELDTIITTTNLAKNLQLDNTRILAIDSTEVATVVDKLLDINIPTVSVSITYTDLAYVIYTSGSSGNPKGVMVEHGAIYAHIQSVIEAFSFSSSDRVLQLASFSFDTFIEQTFASLSVGGTLVLPDESLLESERFFELVSQHDITITDLTPAYLDQLLNKQYDQHWLSSTVTRVVVGGEALKPSIIQRWITLFHSKTNCCELYNAYGPTEGVITTTYRKVTEEDSKRVRIGKLLGQRALYIVDSSTQRCPIGIVGEILIGGLCLARGYLNRENLTNEKFIDSSFDDGKLYRTGDLARICHDGNLEFIGRLDEQIKIRGFRVEPGEVENQLLQSHLVSAASLVVKQDGLGINHLIAYVVLDSKVDELNDIEPALELKQYLQSKLPAYMIPSETIFLEAFPLTPNGKIDRKSLPSAGVYQNIEEYIKPVGSIEIELAEIWAKLFTRKENTISATANFFELGGHSLTAMKLASEIRANFDVEISLKSIFETPQLREIAQLIQKASKLPILPPVLADLTDAKHFVLSFAQQRIWFIEQLDKVSSQYNMSGLLKFSGHFNVELAEQIISRIIERHQILRTNYNENNHGPYQIINNHFDFKISQFDLSQISQPAKTKELEQLVISQAEKKFDLTNDLMLSVSYFSLQRKDNNEQGLLLFNLHHIAADGWSIGILAKEFIDLYRTENNPQKADLSNLPVQYHDYAVWQRELLDKTFLSNQMTYWESQLAGISGVHGIPLKGERPQEKSYLGGVVRHRLSPTLTARIKRFSHQHQVTLFMLLHGALSLVIARHSNNDDVVIGTPVANRLQSQLEPLIGLFVNTLILRANTEFVTIADYLAHIKQTNLNALANQDIPFEQLVERLNVPRSTAYTPIFQIMFTLNEANLKQVEMEDICFTPVIEDYIHPAAKFDLDISAEESEHGIELKWVYDRALFEHYSVTTFSEHFEQILESITEFPQKHLSQLKMLSDQQIQYLTKTLNNNYLDYPKDVLLHQLFEQQVESIPTKVAIEFNGQQETFESLNIRANQLAHYLLLQGIKPKNLIGVRLERSIDMVVTILAILKTGCAYVPLDPAYPEKRLAYIIENAQIGTLITTMQLEQPKLQQHQQLICLDELSVQTRLKSACIDNIAVSGELLQSRDLAYVIYTSGSTGQPKGVAIRHKNASAMIHWSKSVYSESELDRILASTSLNFDLSIFELFVPLCFGYQCVLVKDALVLLDKKLDVSLINTVPSAIKLLLEQDSIPKSTQVINLAGEPLTAQLVNGLLKKRSCKKVCNLYGPSEDTTYSTYIAFTTPLNQIPSIGKPISNTQAYVLSGQRQLVPYGVIGELYLAGDGVAQGYLNNQMLTNERFISNLFGDGVLYRTGDLVRYNPQGELDFIGRIDDQVKIHGFRIELGEIEHSINALSYIKSTVVFAHIDENKNKRLVAYLVCAEQCELNKEQVITQLKASLKLELPEYMVPSNYIFLDDLPLTLSGKVDKKSLPVVDNQIVSEYVAAETKTELLLVKIWSLLLNVEEDNLSVCANFFELGGHSLLIAKMIHFSAQHYGLKLSAKEIFQCPTIRELAVCIDNPERENQIAITRRDIDRPVNLSASQFRIWFVEQLNGTTNENNITGGVKIFGNLTVDKISDTLDYLIQRHTVLRTRVLLIDNEPFQTVENREQACLNYHDLSAEEENASQAKSLQLIEQHGSKVFELYNSSLMSSLVIKLTQDKWLFHVNFHHLIADGWSVSNFINEFIDTYQLIDEKKLQPAIQKELSYIDFSLWQQDFLNSKECNSQELFWKEYLQGASQQLTLPAYELPEENINKNSTGQLNSVSHVVSAESSERLNALGHRCQGSLFNVLHSVLTILVSRLTGESDLNIGIPVSGRNIAGCEDMFGVFINNLPVRSQVKLTRKFEDYLVEQIANVSNVLSNQDLPFEKIIQLTEVSRQTDNSSLFQIFLNVLSLPPVKLANQCLSAEWDKAPAISSKFDLTLYVNSENDGIEINCHFNPAKYSSITIQLFLQQYVSLLSAIAEDSQRACVEYSLELTPFLPESKIIQSAIKNQCNGVDKSGIPDLKEIKSSDWKASVHHLFETNTEQHPERIAVEYDGVSWSYQSLNIIANFYASKLQREGVTKDDVVAIMTRRNDLMVIAILAVLKAGAAFSLLSDQTPVKRLASQLDMLSPKCLLTLDNEIELSPNVEQLLFDARCSVISISDGNVELDSFVKNSEPFVSATSYATDLAYMAFTSGTEGQPKVIKGRHSSLTVYMPWMSKQFGMSENDRFGMLAGLLHDPIQRDIFTPLCMGATLCIPNEVQFEFSKIDRWLKENKVSVLHLTPSLADFILGTQDILLSDLRLVFLSGEKVTNQHVNKLSTSAPEVRVVNLYGSTESSRAVSYFEANNTLSDSSKERVVPVGKGVADTQLIVLNASMQQCGVGELGEIGIRSKHLTLGYHNNDSLTAEKYIVNPLTNDLEDIIYLTGDLGHYLIDGTVVCSGRNDRQVKVRGFRIELAEIEAVVNSNTLISQSVAHIVCADNKEHQVVLFVVVEKEQKNNFNEVELRAFMRDFLPGYMMPVEIILLANIPLTVNGKLDYRQLEMNVSKNIEREVVSPESEVEKSLHKIWQTLLGIQEICVNDDFFDIGGHSLLATRLFVQIKKLYGVELSYKDFFEKNSIRNVAKTIEKVMLVKKVKKSSNKKNKIAL